MLAAVVVLAGHGLLWAADEEEQSVATLPPVVVKTVPESGDTSVDPSTAEIKVTFSKKMKNGAWSWCYDPEKLKTSGKPHYEADGRTCVLAVKLEPGKTYVVWLNSPKFHNFRDAGGRPSLPYLLVFETKQ
jgi:RNA polymerase sigma-70 factor (ECF subfamily)